MHNPAILPPEWLFVKKSCLNNGLGIFFLEKTNSGYHKEKVVFFSHYGQWREMLHIPFCIFSTFSYNHQF